MHVNWRGSGSACDARRPHVAATSPKATCAFPRVMSFLLKIAITPLLVAAVSLAARWWGPTIGGILIGLPWFTGPTLFVLIQDKGIDFGVAACAGIELGVACVAAFILAYGLVSVFARWPLSLAGGTAAFAASAWVAQHPALLAGAELGTAGPLWAASGVGLVALAIANLLLPRPRATPALQALPWWDIPMRMLTTGVLVTVIVLAADAMGPQLSGIMSTYPVIVTVVGTFTHHRWGREAVWRMLRGITASLVSFVAFFLVVGLTLAGVGLIASYALASLVALAITSGLFFLNRARAVS